MTSSLWNDVKIVMLPGRMIVADGYATSKSLYENYLKVGELYKSV